MPYREHPSILGHAVAHQPETVQGGNHEARAPLEGERPRLFAGISSADYASICRAARVKEFACDEMLHCEGDLVQRAILLVSGYVKITRLGVGGEEVIVRLAGSGDLLGVVELFTSGTHCSAAQAFRASEALVWDTRVFKDLLDRLPVLHQNAVTILSAHLRELEDRFREIASERVGPRLALQLLRLLKTMGRPAGTGIEVDISREDLAQMTGTTLFTISRLLSAWEVRGIARSRREVVAICDVQRLRVISYEVSPEE
jgi:CRP-like cAMP-binding protein